MDDLELDRPRGVFGIMGNKVTDQLIAWPFTMKVTIVSLILVPFGVTLGTFFPSGLLLVEKNYKGSIARAWAINCGFTVLVIAEKLLVLKSAFW